MQQKKVVILGALVNDFATFLAKTCSYRQFSRLLPLSPVRDSSPAALVHVGVPIQGLLCSTRCGLAAFSDWWVATNSELMAAQPSTYWSLEQVPLRWRSWLDYPDSGGGSFTDDCPLFSEERRYLSPPPVAFLVSMGWRSVGDLRGISGRD